VKALQRIFAVVMKEIRQLRRDRLTFGMIIGIPTMQLLLFGYAINFDVRHLSAGVADLSASAASRQYVMQLANSQVIDIEHQAADARELEELMRQGRISVGIACSSPTGPPCSSWWTVPTRSSRAQPRCWRRPGAPRPTTTCRRRPRYEPGTTRNGVPRSTPCRA
jgi:hypothetical protein